MRKIRRFYTDCMIHTLVDNAECQRGTIVTEDDKIIDIIYGNKLNGMTDTRIDKYVDNSTNLSIMDMDSKHVYPGFIDPHSHIGLNKYAGEGNSETNEFNGHINKLHISDSYNPFSEEIYEGLKSGIVLSCICPGSASIVSGFCALVRYDHSNVFKSVIDNEAALKMALGDNPLCGNGGHSQAGIIDQFRTMMNSDDRLVHRLKNKELPVKIHCHYATDIMRAISLINEYGLHGSIDHCTEIARVIEWTPKDHLHDNEYLNNLFKNISVIVGPLEGGKSKAELKFKGYDICDILRRNGIEFSLCTDCCEIYPPSNLLKQMRHLYIRGWDIYDALKLVTINPAKVLGVSNMYGTIEIGKRADLIVCTGEIQRYDTNIVNMIVGGDFIDVTRIRP